MSNYPGNYSQPGYGQGAYAGYTQGQTGPPAAAGYQARPGAPPSVAGYQGPQGHQGTPGYQGAAAYQQGAQGYQQGAQGYQQRAQGYQVTPGYQGYQGTPGYQGGYPGTAAPSAPPSHGYPGGQAMRAPPPGADPNLWNWFMTVDRDQSGQITADELKQALINGNWSHFNEETCRLMISMFDKDQSGTINFSEFTNLWTYIQQWKGVFNRYDQDRSGAIESNELQTALNEMGYRVSPSFVSLLIARFDSKARQSMKLDSFIQCCVMLRLLTDAFRARDTNQNGVINVNYEDFMCMVIENKA